MKISIITAVFNRRDTIGQALASVQAQSWQKVEHIIIDGGSTDGTLELVKSCAGANSVLVSEPDAGIYHALNKGLALATGDVVGFMHSDDFFADDQVIARVADCLVNQAVDGVYGDLDYVLKSDPKRIIRHWHAGQYSRDQLAKGWMPPHPTLYLRRGVIEQWGGFDPSFRIASDYDAILRYLGQGNIKLQYIPSVMVKMRTGGASNSTVARVIRKSVEDYAALRRNSIGGLRSLLWKNLSKLPQFILKEDEAASEAQPQSQAAP